MFRRKTQPNKHVPVKERYVVRAASEQDRYTVIEDLWMDSVYKDVIFDAFTGNYVYTLQRRSGTTTAVYERCRALNKEHSNGAVEQPYIFDCLLGQKVYENESLQNCSDHARALNQADQEWREKAAVNRWQDVALALIRAQLKHHPAGWQVRDTGMSIEVRSLDGDLIASCETYADAAAVQALSEIEFSNPMSFVPRSTPELPRKAE